MSESEEEVPLDPASMVETPVDLRPDLTIYGIDEYDKGICEDSSRNRMILRKNKLSFHPIYDTTGRPTGQIEVLSLEMQEGRSLHALEDRKSILKDPRDKNSDYLTGLDLLYAGHADSMVPPWIISATKDFDQLEDRRAERPEKNYRPNLTEPPGRCRYVKADGIRCLNWHAGRLTDDQLCRTHLGSLNANAGTGAVERARQRVQQSAARAVDVIEQMMDTATSEQIRLRAAEQLLDRAGVRGGVEIDMNATVAQMPAADALAERLGKLAAAAERMKAEAAEKEAESDMLVLEAEVVEDDDRHGN
jgi:hypothetical protein